MPDFVKGFGDVKKDRSGFIAGFEGGEYFGGNSKELIDSGIARPKA